MKHHYYKLYKPYKYISQFITNDAKARNKQFLGILFDFPKGIMAIGRLDEKTEGLLLLTTNGKYSTHITKGGIEKEYYVQVDGIPDQDALQKLRDGVTISVEGKPYTTKPAIIKPISSPVLPPTRQHIRDDRHGPTSWISLTITEGKFRQVRKMTAAVGHPTLRLVRYRVGNETIDGMDSGDVKEIAINTFK